MIYTNTGFTLNTVEIDFGNGQGYQAVSLNTVKNVSYTSGGEKEMKVKFGSALAKENQDNEIIVIPGLKGRTPKEISTKNLACIIPVTNTSVNPARSTSQAIFVGGWALQQLWLFWVAPIAGGVLAGITHRWLSARQ